MDRIIRGVIWGKIRLYAFQDNLLTNYSNDKNAVSSHNVAVSQNRELFNYHQNVWTNRKVC